MASAWRRLGILSDGLTEPAGLDPALDTDRPNSSDSDLCSLQNRWETGPYGELGVPTDKSGTPIDWEKMHTADREYIPLGCNTRTTHWLLQLASNNPAERNRLAISIRDTLQQCTQYMTKRASGYSAGSGGV